MAEEEDKENPCAAFAKDRNFGGWLIDGKLDEGGFGQVYKVRNAKDPSKFAALKAEPNDVEGGAAIKLEMHVLTTMTEGGVKEHIPIVYHAAKHKKFCYMVMMLLGSNLKYLKNSSSDEKMTAQTWARLAIQCTYAIKLVHDHGFIHRDIKPNNFVLGYSDDNERCRLVHILDFGLTRPYATKGKDGKWVPRRARGSAEFRGTLRYCSPNVHIKQEQGRRDDLWGLLYILIEFHCGLPWQKITDRSKVEVMKLNIDDRVLCQNMPHEIVALPRHLKTLDCYQRPDYSLFHNAFVSILKRLRVNWWDPYDWETRENLDKLKKEVNGKLPSCENAVEFFKSDPVGVSGPPPPGPSTRQRKTDKEKESDRK